MMAFYFYDRFFLIALTMLGAVCVLLQCAVMLLSLYRHRVNHSYVMENLAEMAAVAHLFLLSVLVSGVLLRRDNGLVLPSEFTLARWIVFAVIALGSAWVGTFRNRITSILLLISAVIVLPPVEERLGMSFPYFYVLSMVICLLRGVFLCVKRRREFRTDISALSIKEALDALQTGILFSDYQGTILLMNRKMQSLMLTLAQENRRNAVLRNALLFLDLLAEGPLLEGIEKIEMDGQAVYCLEDGSAWMVKHKILHIGKKQYRQITAAAVTAQWEAAKRLREQNAILKKRSNELKTAIDNVKRICREEETLRAKSRIHDVMGQKIALLLRALREQKEPDIELLQTFRDGLPENMKNPEAQADIQSELSSMIEIFGGIGVEIVVEGDLPSSSRAAGLFMEVITEGVTNAVRHGFSTKVNIRCDESPEKWTLCIADNGLSVTQEVSEGGGLGNMRRKLESFSGTLQMDVSPHFTLVISIPKGGTMF